MWDVLIESCLMVLEKASLNNYTEKEAAKLVNEMIAIRMANS